MLVNLYFISTEVIDQIGRNPKGSFTVRTGHP